MAQPARGDTDDGLHRRLRPERPRKTALTVAQRIVNDISRQKSGSGTVLPTERDMLVQYDVGRSTLREALRYLEMNGVISVKPGPGGGPIVATPDADDLAGMLGLFLELQGTSVSAVFELRELLEPTVAYLAAVRGSDEPFVHLAVSIATMTSQLRSIEVFRTESRRFHMLLAKTTGNPALTALIGSLCSMTQSWSIGNKHSLELRQSVAAAHHRIFAAVTERDADSAMAAMRAHMTEVRAFVETVGPNVVDQPLRWSDVATL